MQAAVDARKGGADILVMARTDANATDGMEEAILRAKSFVEIGADITFLEAPRSEEEMRAYCEQVPGPKMANLVEQGDTPLLLPDQLEAIGYKIALYPITTILAAQRAIEQALAALREGSPPERLAEFAELREVVGFPEYYAAEQKYTAEG
jgi:2-methylisocitrate lyase-like PEP mutase family enzyme